MASPKQPTTTAAAAAAAPPARASLSDYYLALYNLISATLWFSILKQTLTHLLSASTLTSGNAAVWRSLSPFALALETAAALEVLHALPLPGLGRLVRASPLTTALQVAGRNTVLWAIARNYPNVMESGVGVGYASLLLAWSAAEVVRYSYFVVALSGKIVGSGEAEVPGWLVWIRYNMFIPLYPWGILSECWLIYNVIEPSKERQTYYQYLLWFGLFIYIPASYILFSHMLSQRRKMTGTAHPNNKIAKRS